MGTPIPINIDNTFGATEAASQYQITGNICVFTIIFKNSKKEIASNDSFLLLSFSTVVNQTPILVYYSTGDKNVCVVALNNGEIVAKESIPINHSLRISGAFIIS